MRSLCRRARLIAPQICKSLCLWNAKCCALRARLCVFCPNSLYPSRILCSFSLHQNCCAHKTCIVDVAADSLTNIIHTLTHIISRTHGQPTHSWHEEGTCVMLHVVSDDDDDVWLQHRVRTAVIIGTAVGRVACIRICCIHPLSLFLSTQSYRNRQTTQTHTHSPDTIVYWLYSFTRSKCRVLCKMYLKNAKTIWRNKKQTKIHYKYCALHKYIH